MKSRNLDTGGKCVTTLFTIVPTNDYRFPLLPSQLIIDITLSLDNTYGTIDKQSLDIRKKQI